MRYISLFDGIGAACVAWQPLGWECVGVSEVEQFPMAVTKHHRPNVPHLGDITKITESDIKSLGRIDLVVGGFPCQDLSVAGKRAGLRNEDGSATRSGLFFDAMRVVRWARQHGGCRWLLIENVPGLYSSNGGRDFASVVREMAGCEFGVPADGWRNAGVAVGPEGFVEWATLDAQFFGVAQRRRRLFALADFGDWSGRPPILFERESLLGNPPPRREAGKGIAGPIAGCSNGGGANGPGRTADDADSLIPVEQPFEVANCLPRRMHKGINTTIDEGQTPVIAHSLRAEHDASEDGTGRGTPLVPVETVGTMKACKDSGGWSNSADHAAAGYMVPVAFDTTQITSKANYSSPKAGDPCHPLAAGAHPPAVAFQSNQSFDSGNNIEISPTLRIGSGGQGKPPAIAFSSKDHGADAGDTSPTLRAMGHAGSHANAGGQVAVALNIYGGNKRVDRPEGGFYVKQEETTKTLDAAGGLNPTAAQGGTAVMSSMQVRRLTPRECERLQGFPDDYTLIPVRGKPAADGPRYKALGNSMAVPVMSWIGQRIQMVEEVCREKEMEAA